MATDADIQALIGFLKRDVIRKTKLDIDADTPLVSSGLIDSFALIDVLLGLENITGRKIPVGRVSPADFETVRSMLLTAERVGQAKP